jgi:cytochrome b pre-mRNA-processing protein 3
MLLRSSRRRERQDSIERLYGAIVAQSRLPIFYARWGVPDTLEGRFDILVLHVHLLFRRLANESAEARAVAQGVFDRFVSDMDASLRELGVGDLAVPKRMRAMGEAFYGRAAAYDTALADADDKLLAGALMRNVYGGRDDARPFVRELAYYVRAAVRELMEQDAVRISCGDVRFRNPADEDRWYMS